MRRSRAHARDHARVHVSAETRGRTGLSSRSAVADATTSQLERGTRDDSVLRTPMPRTLSTKSVTHDDSRRLSPVTQAPQQRELSVQHATRFGRFDTPAPRICRVQCAEDLLRASARHREETPSIAPRSSRALLQVQRDARARSGYLISEISVVLSDLLDDGRERAQQKERILVRDEPVEPSTRARVHWRRYRERRHRGRRHRGRRHRGRRHRGRRRKRHRRFSGELISDRVLHKVPFMHGSPSPNAPLGRGAPARRGLARTRPVRTSCDERLSP